MTNQGWSSEHSKIDISYCRNKIFEKCIEERCYSFFSSLFLASDKNASQGIDMINLTFINSHKLKSPIPYIDVNRAYKRLLWDS